jgi:pimeloyl-ACP methyl ester carboxylesterase
VQQDFILSGQHIEAVWYGPRPEAAPTLVLLHEGLGSVALWKDFPPRLAERTGCGVFAYSRRGYGRSDPRPLPWPVSYMHDEAREVLPALLDAAGIRRAILIGHSDGASIATIYAGSHQDFRIRGLVLLAPHFFVEDLTIRSIEAAREAYASGGLRERLAKYHADVDIAFGGWNGAWLDPAFRQWRIDEELAYVRVPVLIIQGEDDPYGTVAQITLAQQETYCPVDAVMLKACGHAPQGDQPEATIAAIADFVHRLLVLHEGLAA